MSNTKRALKAGNTYLGIEFGSTRIKAVLIDESTIRLHRKPYMGEPL